ncbi:MAG: GNAT family N-acetyltransferase [Dongiaceae bacterium]
MTLAISLEPLRDPAALAAEWQALQARARASFFQSWSWIGCWLGQLPPEARPLLLRADQDGRAVALALLLRRTGRRRLAIRSRGLHLHDTGGSALDAITIERNGLLVDAALPGLSERCLAWLAAEAEWDELHLPGIDAAQALRLERLGLPLRILDRKPCFVAALDRPAEAALSGNTRSQLRRSIRLYEAEGPLRLEAAGGVDEALAILDQLKQLHQDSWRARGRPGAFAVASFERFHRALIAARFPAGEIQLLRIRAGGRVVGCLYNLRQGSRVYSYQSGLERPPTARHKPGMVCHALAMDWSRAAGAQRYDFLAGANQLKRSLGCPEQELVWAVVQRDRLRFRLERRALALVGRSGGPSRPGRADGPAAATEA